MTIITMLIVDKIEQRKLLQISLSGISVCLLIAFILLSYIKEYPYGDIFPSYLLLFSFAIGQSALVLALLPEMLLTNIRSVGMSLALSFSSFSGALITSIFLPVKLVVGLQGVFLICVIVYLVFSYFIPDMNGKSLENITLKTNN